MHIVFLLLLNIERQFDKYVGLSKYHSCCFLGYYVPRSDGEFYQFCYVTHTGEIRGASTPFQFRPATPTGEELLTVEDDGNSDILVVTTKTGLLEVLRTLIHPSTYIVCYI